MYTVTQVPDVALQVARVFFNRNPIDACSRPSALTPKRAQQSLNIHMVQQRCKPGLARSMRRLVHSGKPGWKGDPALHPDLCLLTTDPLEPRSSLRTPRTIFLR
jgi:hypothetical protein